MQHQTLSESQNALDILMELASTEIDIQIPTETICLYYKAREQYQSMSDWPDDYSATVYRTATVVHIGIKCNFEERYRQVHALLKQYSTTVPDSCLLEIKPTRQTHRVQTQEILPQYQKQCEEVKKRRAHKWCIIQAHLDMLKSEGYTVTSGEIQYSADCEIPPEWYKTELIHTYYFEVMSVKSHPLVKWANSYIVQA